MASWAQVQVTATNIMLGHVLEALGISWSPPEAACVAAKVDGYGRSAHVTLPDGWADRRQILVDTGWVQGRAGLIPPEALIHQVMETAIESSKLPEMVRSVSLISEVQLPNLRKKLFPEAGAAIINITPVVFRLPRTSVLPEEAEDTLHLLKYFGGEPFGVLERAFAELDAGNARFYKTASGDTLRVIAQPATPHGFTWEIDLELLPAHDEGRRVLVSKKVTCSAWHEGKEHVFTDSSNTLCSRFVPPFLQEEGRQAVLSLL